MSEKASKNREPDNGRPFTGGLTPVDAANAIRSARLTALELLDTADLLYSLKRFAHSMALSILAIEESTKAVILFELFLDTGGNRAKIWKSYRNHHAKTAWLNFAIQARVRATFPNIPREETKQLEEAGPTPEQLEISKQRAIYSDCLEISGKFIAHSPTVVDWRKQAWERLCEAKSMCHALRDRPPEELQIFQEYVARAATEGKSLASLMPELHKDLLERGMVQEGWWTTLLQDIDHNETQAKQRAENKEELPGL
jgi:AbiV family abortive infection protein